MNREIKFKGKRVDNGEWVYGDIHKNIDFTKAHIHPEGEMIVSYKVIPETVGQYTGLKDKNGVEIYEGDKLKCLSRNVFSRNEISIHNVIFGQCAWWVNDTYMNLVEYLEYGDCEVIGNIHEDKK